MAPWHVSLTADTTGWEPGFYVLRLRTTSGWEHQVPYIVSSPSAAGTIAVVVPVTTWQAYNLWGGYSLYDGPTGDRRSWAVSFDRPYHGVGGMNDFHISVVPIVVRAEMTGEPLSYFANVDLHDDHDLLAGALGYVSTGHDEYWTPSMRTTVETARDAGTNLAFLGANTAYWRVRLDDRPTGPRRLMTGYRHDAALDPLRDETPAEATSRFRDAPAAEPENALTGMLYECYPVDADYVVVSPKWWGFAGTGVRYGTAIPGLVGGESDRVYPDRLRATTTAAAQPHVVLLPRRDDDEPVRLLHDVVRSRGLHGRHAALGLRARRPLRPPARHPDPGLRPPGDGQPVPRVRGRSGRRATPGPGQRRGLRPAARQHGRGELSRCVERRISAIMAPMRAIPAGRLAVPARGCGGGVRAWRSRRAPTTPMIPPPSDGPESVALELSLGPGADGLTTEARDDLQNDVGAVLTTYVVEGFLGDYPRDDFVERRWTRSPAASPARPPGTSSRSPERGSRTPTRSWRPGCRPASPPSRPVGKAVGVSAHVDFAFDVTEGESTREVTLRGRLMLMPVDGEWKIFGYQRRHRRPEPPGAVS